MGTKVQKAEAETVFNSTFKSKEEYSAPLHIGDRVRVVTPQAQTRGLDLEGTVSYIDSQYRLYRIEGVEGAFARGDLELVTKRR